MRVLMADVYMNMFNRLAR